MPAEIGTVTRVLTEGGEAYDPRIPLQDRPIQLDTQAPGQQQQRLPLAGHIEGQGPEAKVIREVIRSDRARRKSLP